MVSFRGKNVWATPRLVSFRGLIQNFRRASLPLSYAESPPGANRSGGRVGKGRRACNCISGIWIPHPIPLWLPIECQISANQHEAVNVNNMPRVMTSLSVMSTNQHFASTFGCTYLNSREVVASTPSFPALPPECPGRELARRLTKIVAATQRNTW